MRHARGRIGLGPLNPRVDPNIFVLVSLADSPKHGYALMEDIESFAGVRLGPGSLYGCLARLEARGLIEPLPAEDRRNPYRLTAAGAAVLHQEVDRLSSLTAVATRRLGEAR